jgi:hypothetical protein
VTEDLFLFSQEDPIPARLRYGYGRNAPLTYADPSGLAVWVFNAFSEGDYDAQLERSISAQLCRVGVGYLRAGEFRPGDIPRLVGPGDDVIVLGHSVGLADDTGDMLVGDGDIFNQENYFFLGGHGVNLRVKSLSLVGCHTDRIVDFPSLYQIPGAVVLGDEDTVRLLSFAAKLAIALQRDPNMPISDLVTSALTGANRDPFIDPSVPPMSARAR